MWAARKAHPRLERNGEAAAESSALPGVEPCLSYRRITENWFSVVGINRVPDVGFFSCVPLRSEAIVVLDKLRKVGNYVRKGWSSTDPGSYSHYKRGRERQRKQAERSHEEADRSAELDREEVQRGREYEERYAAERAAEEPQTESPRDDMGKPE